jgi:hypothetical protein
MSTLSISQNFSDEYIQTTAGSTMTVRLNDLAVVCGKHRKKLKRKRRICFEPHHQGEYVCGFCKCRILGADTVWYGRKSSNF